MRYSKLVLILLLLAVTSCSDENLIGVDGQDALSTPEATIQPPTDAWFAASVQLDVDKVDAALTGHNTVMQVGLATYYPDPAYTTMLQCFDAGGNPVPGAMLPLRFLVEGRVQYLGKITGTFGGGSCLVNEDFTLTVTREWRYVGEDGHAIYGTYVATVFPDGSFTSQDLVTGGIGKFAGATGWGRSAGKDGTVYTRGILTAPRDVLARSFIGAIENGSSSGRISCVDHLGNPTSVTSSEELEAAGLSNYGPVEVSVVNESCISYGDVSEVYGSATYTFVQGDELRATFTVVIGVAEPWPNAVVFIGGTGRFEGVTGWADVLVYWDDRRDDQSGMLFFPL